MVQIWSAFLLKTTINHFFFNLKQTPIPKETFLAVCKLKCLQLMGSKNATKSLNWCARFLKIFYRAVSIIFHILYGMRNIQIWKPSNRLNDQFVYNRVKLNTIFCPLLLSIFLDQPVTYNELHSYVNLTRKLKLPPTIYAFIYIKQFSISFRAVTAYMYIYHVPRKPTTPLAY